MEVHGPPYIFCLLFKKTEKVQEHDLYLNQILHHFYLKKIPRMIKNFTKRRPQGAPHLFLYKMNIVVLIDFIAILLTPGIFLIQIVNTNMHLIHFHSKNIIKMRFPSVGFLKFQTCFRHSLSIITRWNKSRWHQQRRHNTVLKTHFHCQAQAWQWSLSSNNYYLHFFDY